MYVSKCCNQTFGAVYLANNIEGAVLSMSDSGHANGLRKKLKQCANLKFFDVYVKENGETYVKDRILGEVTPFNNECFVVRLKTAMNSAIQSERKLRKLIR